MRWGNRVLGFLGIWLACTLGGYALAENLTLDNYSLISKNRVSRTDFEYTYHADITNTGPVVENVVATLSSTSPHTIVVDGDLSFGFVGAGTTVTGSDTFTIRQNRRFPFSWADLSWAVSFDLPTQVGVLLEGPPGMLAVDAMVDLPPVPVEPTEIAENGLFLNQLNVIIRPDATVEQINSALLQIGGGITSMSPGFPFFTAAIPHQQDIDAIRQVVALFKESPGVISAFPSYEPELDLIPGDLDRASIDYLARARFPAAWNAAELAFDPEDESQCARRVHVLVADYFATPSADLLIELGSQLPDFVVGGSAGAGTEVHGWNVLATLGAMLDGTPPTGANPAPPAPLPTCLDLRGLNISRLGQFDIPRAIADEILRMIKSSGPRDIDRVILNASFGFSSRCPDTGATSSCDAEARPMGITTFAPTPAIERAEQALYWKTYLKHIDLDAEDFLVVAAAGNSKDNQAAAIHPGLGVADYTSFFTVASRADPDFSFISDASLWPATGDPRLTTEFIWPSLLASPDDAANFRAVIEFNEMEGVPPLSNVIIVGSTTNPELAQGNDYRLNTELIMESDFSSNDGAFPGRVITDEGTPITLPPRAGNLGWGADVYAAGEWVSVLDGRFANGTSFAAPQVAGLASYLWLIAQEDAIPADLISQTIAIIADTVEPGLCQIRIASGDCERPISQGIIDAYAATLALDSDPEFPLDEITAEAPIREAILNVNEEDPNSVGFDVSDIADFLGVYFGSEPVLPELGFPFVPESGDPFLPEPWVPMERDYSRYDLNGDGFTGGIRDTLRRDFELDLTDADVALLPMIPLQGDFGSGTEDLFFKFEEDFAVGDDHGLIDIEILCYYAYSGLFRGGDFITRDYLLIGPNRCREAQLTPEESIVSAAQGVDLTPVLHAPTDRQPTLVDFQGETVDTLPVPFYLTGSYGSAGTTVLPRVEWTSSDPTIANVDEHGRVHGIRAGVVEIQAKQAPEIFDFFPPSFEISENAGQLGTATVTVAGAAPPVSDQGTVEGSITATSSFEDAPFACSWALDFGNGFELLIVKGHYPANNPPNPTYQNRISSVRVGAPSPLASFSPQLDPALYVFDLDLSFGTQELLPGPLVLWNNETNAYLVVDFTDLQCVGIYDSSIPVPVLVGKTSSLSGSWKLYDNTIDDPIDWYLDPRTSTYNQF